MAEQTVEEYLAEQKAVWGTYVAVNPIDINGARAFNVGDPVPKGHVEGQKQGVFDPETEKVTWTDVPPLVRPEDVAKVTTKAAQAATKEK